MVMIQLLFKLFSGLSGYRVWKKIKNTKLKRDGVLIILDDFEKYGNLLLDNIFECKKCHGYRRIIVCVNSKKAKECLSSNACFDDVICLSSVKFNNLCNFYNSNNLLLPIIFASLEKPAGRNLNKYLDLPDTDERQLFRIGVLGIIP